MRAIGRDIREALRRLLRRPAFAVVAIATLALAIGASAAFFTLLNTFALRRLPVDRPDELVRLSTSTIDEPDQNLSFPMFQQLRRQTTVFSDVIGSIDGFLGNIELDGHRSRAFVRCVTGNYYSMLGARPLAGRLLEPADVPLDSMRIEPVAVVSEEFWERRLGGRLSIVGQPLRLEGIDFTIVGIAPKGWSGTSSSVVPDLVVPLTAVPAMSAEPSSHFFEGSGSLWLQTVGRLRPGVSIDTARAALTGAWPGVRAAALPPRYTALERQRFLSLPLNVTSAARGADPSFVADVTRALTMAMAIAGLILVIACVNLAGLLLSRVATRSTEIGVRLSLGASLASIVRGVVIEAALVSVGGAAGGVVVGAWAVRTIKASWFALNPMTTPIPDGVDGRMLAFAAGVAFVVAALVSVVAVWWLGRRSTSMVRLSPGRTQTPRVGRFGPALVTAQIALSLVIVSAAALLARNVEALRSEQDIGYRREGLTVTTLQPVPGGYVNADNDRYQPEVLARIAALPGIRGAVFSSGAPLFSGLASAVAPVAGGHTETAPESGVSPGLFDLIGVPLVAGRDFTWRDDSHAPRVAIVSRRLAVALFGTRPAPGEHIRIGDAPGNQDVDIVGVAADAKLDDVRSAKLLALYVPLLQMGDYANWKALVIRTAIGTLPAERDLSDAFAPFGHEYVDRVNSLRQWVDDSLLIERDTADLSAGAAAIALVLVVVGLYGLWAFLVTQRRKEMGIRLALGAGFWRIARMIFAGGLRIAAVGIVVGGVAAFLAGRILRSFLTGVSPADPIAMTVAAALVIAASVAACLVPAWRAASIDPVSLLRVD